MNISQYMKTLPPPQLYGIIQKYLWTPHYVTASNWGSTAYGRRVCMKDGPVISTAHKDKSTIFYF